MDSDLEFQPLDLLGPDVSMCCTCGAVVVGVALHVQWHAETPSAVTWTFNAAMLQVMRQAMQIAAASGQFSAIDASWLNDWAEDSTC